MPNPEVLGPASLSIGTATSAFMGFLPRFSEVRRAEPDDEGMSKDVLLGEIAATSVAMATGLIVSSITGSPLPTVVAAIMCLLLVWCYESAKRTV